MSAVSPLPYVSQTRLRPSAARTVFLVAFGSPSPPEARGMSRQASVTADTTFRAVMGASTKQGKGPHAPHVSLWILARRSPESHGKQHQPGAIQRRERQHGGADTIQGIQDRNRPG